MLEIDGRMMCFSNVAHLSFAERVRAARLAGCDQLSIMPVEVKELVAQGLPIAEMRSIADAAGVTVSRLDPLVRWSRIWKPNNMSAAYVERISDSPEEFFALADHLGCRHASLNATFPLGSLSIDEIIESYAAICARAAEHGMTCDLEFIPLWGVPDLETAWRIVNGAAAPNGGLVFDTWHYIRGQPNPELLRSIPGHLIHSVQLNDGLLRLAPGVTLEQDCFQRLFPGDGEFPLIEVVSILAGSGGLRELGAEVFNPMLNSMSTEAVATRCRVSIDSVLCCVSQLPSLARAAK